MAFYNRAKLADAGVRRGEIRISAQCISAAYLVRAGAQKERQ